MLERIVMMVNEEKKRKSSFYWNLNGEIEQWEEGRLTHILITDENDRYITLLDVHDCKNEKDMHFKMMQSFWDYCTSKGEKAYIILKKIIERFPYFEWREYVEFYSRVLAH